MGRRMGTLPVLLGMAVIAVSVSLAVMGVIPFNLAPFYRAGRRLGRCLSSKGAHGECKNGKGG